MTKKFIRAAFLTAPRSIEIAETTAPDPGPNEILISPIYTAICGSDLSFYNGHRKPKAYPNILGHEVVGEVIGVGNQVTKFSKGQRVVVEPNYTCGTCDFCKSGRGNICPNKKSLGVTIPGCFAEKFVAPEEFSWLIPDSITNENAVAIEPLAVSLHAFWQAGIKKDDIIAVIGCGSTGLLLIHAAVSNGVKVIAHDKAHHKIEMAHKLGAQISDRSDLSPSWTSEGVTTIFECAGVSQTVEMALRAAPRGSRIILMGLSPSLANFEPLRFVREGLILNGSIIYDHPGDFSKTIALVEKKALTPKKIITHTFGFEKIKEAMETASSEAAGKVIIKMNGE